MVDLDGEASLFFVLLVIGAGAVIGYLYLKGWKGASDAMDAGKNKRDTQKQTVDIEALPGAFSETPQNFQLQFQNGNVPDAIRGFSGLIPAPPAVKIAGQATAAAKAINPIIPNLPPGVPCPAA